MVLIIKIISGAVVLICGIPLLIIGLPILVLAWRKHPR